MPSISCSNLILLSNPNPTCRRHILEIHLKQYEAQRSLLAFQELRRNVNSKEVDLERCLLFKPDEQGRRRKRYDAMDRTDCKLNIYLRPSEHPVTSNSGLTQDKVDDTLPAPPHEANGTTIARQFNAEYNATNDSGRLIIDFLHELGDDARKQFGKVIRYLDENSAGSGKRDANSLSNSEGCIETLLHLRRIMH